MELERRVERERVFDAEPAEVWEALTDEALLREWLGDDVSLEPYEGGELHVRDGGVERDGTIERVEEGRSLAFTWSRDGEIPSSVELTLEPVVSGTRLRVVERAGAGPMAATAGPLWEMRLGGLAKLLALALV
jgi:uncharacterized protein YndB with AHSA1/START domain